MELEFKFSVHGLILKRLVKRALPLMLKGFDKRLGQYWIGQLQNCGPIDTTALKPFGLNP